MLPKVNQHIVINTKNQGLLGRSLVAEVKEKEILIGFPIGADFIVLPDGTLVDITYVMGESQYKFQSKIIGKKLEKIPLYRIAKPKENEINKIQRRENFRVDCDLKLKVRETELHTVNISAGGILFSCMKDFPVKQDDYLTGTLYIPGTQANQTTPVSFQGIVIRVYLENDHQKNVAIEFTRLDKQNQTKIIQYCFEMQRKSRMNSRTR